MTNCSISTLAVTCDQYADYVPFASTVTNIIDLIAKVVLAILEECCPPCYAEIKSNPWVDYIVNQKDVVTCLELAIPLYNIYAAISLAQVRLQEENDRRTLRKCVRMLGGLESHSKHTEGILRRYASHVQTLLKDANNVSILGTRFRSWTEYSLG